MTRLEPVTYALDSDSLLIHDSAAVGREMHELMTELYPICRSISGNGVRITHDLIRRLIPLESKEVPTGTQVFDWTVPREWNVRDAYVIGPNGTKIIDFQRCNLHLLNYSVPIRARMPLAELREHLYTLPDQPGVIPYRTTYYRDAWGFCLSYEQYSALSDGEYEVVIDTTLEDGYLTYGELFLQGESEEQFLISCYTCHPSLCNDNLSGVVLTTFLAKHLLGQARRRFSYRFLFIPETIGAITWLALNEVDVPKIRHGLVATCLGDPGVPTYKRSRRGRAEIDRAVEHVLRQSGEEYRILDFFPTGSDERQFCSPGFNLPIGSLMRTPYGRFSEYHTSADNLSFVRPSCLANSFDNYLKVIFIIEQNLTYYSLNPKCEPQLGRRGLYRQIGGSNTGAADLEEALYWVLNFSDGENSLLDIAERSGLAFRKIRHASELLCQHSLLGELSLAA